MSQSRLVSLSATVIALSLSLVSGQAQAQEKWVSDIANSMNEAAAGQPVDIGQGTPLFTAPGGAQPSWVRDIGNSMNAAAGTTVVDVGPAPQPAPIVQQPVSPEYLGDSVPLSLPATPNGAQNKPPMQGQPAIHGSLMPQGNMGMPNQMMMQGNMYGNMMPQGNMMMNNMGYGCSGHFHGCCGGHHQQQAMDPCKMFFGMSQQEVGATAAVAGMMLYPTIVENLIKSNPQMQTQVSRFLGAGPAAGF